MEPRSGSGESSSPPFCYRDDKSMSLTEQAFTQVQGENGTEYHLITTPVTVGEDGVIHVQQLPGGAGTEQQENIDPNTHVLMLQPIITEDGQQVQQVLLQGHQVLGDNGQIQILQEGFQFQEDPGAVGLLQDNQVQLQLAELTQQQQLELTQLQPVVQAAVLENGQEETPAIPAHQATQVVKPPVGKGPFRCEICDKIFPKWNQLQRHLRGHEEDKPHRCPQCAATFNIESNLKLHVATHVTENPNCPECGKKFSRIASLKAHIMLHEKEENLMCPECGDEFNIQNQLDKHMREHREEQAGTKSYACKQCTQEYSKLALLREHMKQHYKIKHSLSHRTYKRNMDRSGFSHECVHCKKSFQKPSQLERHIRIHTGERPYKCNRCDKAFNQKGALQIHMTKHTGDRPHMCEFCPATFAQKGNLRAHIQRVHSHPTNSDAPMYQCEECTCVFKKLGSLNAHISRVHSDGPVTTETQVIEILQDGVKVVVDTKEAMGDPQLVATPVSVEGQKTVNDVIQQLLELSEQVSDPEATQQQIQQIAVSGNISSDLLQQALENSGLTVTTEVSGAGTATISAVTSAAGAATSGASGEATSSAGASSVASGTRSHTAIAGTSGTQTVVTSTMTIHDSATGTVKRHLIRKVNGVRWHQCTYCSKEFKKPSDLVRHIRIHTHEKPYKCSLCFRAFAVKSTLTAHVKTHTGVKEFRCQVCDKLFSTQGSLKVHLRLHTGAKPFSCPDCDKKFRTSGHRKSHMQSHYKENSPRKPRRPIKRPPKPDIPLPEIPMQEPIIITDTGLIQQPPRNSQVYNQFLGEAGSVDRPYKCGYCSRGFKKSSHLKQHVRSHTGEKPYKCVQCLRSFVSSGVLKAHIRTHSGVKSYKCLICDATFTTNGSLKRHMSTHSEVRPFMCPYCQKTFKTSVNCKKHMKTHRHELAMQALNQDGMTEPVLDPEKAHEVTIGPDIVDDDDDDDDDDADVGVVHTVVEESQLEVTAATGDLQSQLNQEQQAATLALQQQEFGPTLGQAGLEQAGQAALATGAQQTFSQTALTQQDLGQAISQQAVIQDALVTDASLQSTLNQQLLGQNFQQETLNQSVLGQSAFSQLNYSQFGLQTQPTSGSLVTNLPTSLDVSFSTAAPSLTSTSMQNILQTREPDSDQELIQPQNPHQVVIHQDYEENRRTYKCLYCDKAFKKSSHLKQHIRSHTGERPFKCLQCSRQFVSMGVLKAHMRTHSGVKDYRCTVCQATFTTNGSLTRHMMIHSTVQPFKCPYCNETFRTAFHCRRHMRLHRPAHSENVEVEGSKRGRSAVIQITEEQAEVLSKTTPDESMSVSEKLLIQSAAEKDRISEVKEIEIVRNACGHHQHTCEHCPKTFKKPSDLVRHLRIHTGEKPFACDICGRSFTVKSTLDSHFKTHQVGASKTFKCHVCASGFSTRGSLKVHMRLHTGAKPFKCPHCEQRFRTSGHRKSHIASHFKPVQPRKPRRVVRTSLDINEHVQQQISLLEAQGQIQNISIPGGQVNVANQVISVDSAGNLIQGAVPVSLAVQDSQQFTFTENGLASQVLQGLDGVQLQLTTAGGLGQGIQITGLDPSLLNQTVQIDASLLQQLQSHGMANLTINPNLLQNQNLQTVDPNSIQNIQVQQGASASEALNSNVVIQQPGLTGLDQSTLTQSSLAQQGVIGQEQVQMSAVSAADTTATVDPSAGVIVSTTDQQQLQQQLQQQQQQLQQQQQIQQLQQSQALDEQQLQQQVEGAESVEHITQPEEVDDMAEDGDDEDSENEDTGVPEGVSEEHIQYDTKLEQLPIITQEQADAGVASDTATIQFTLQPLTGTGVLTADSLLTTSVTTPITIQPNDPGRNHICQVCNKAFKRMGHLKEHLLTHAEGPLPARFKTTPHKCNTCDKSFAKPSQLERHIRIHTGERPFQCQECTKAFNQKNALMVHLKKHRGERPHRCPYCELAFTQKGNLKTHIKRAHHLEMVQSMNIPKGANDSCVVADDKGELSAAIEHTSTERESIDLEGVVKDFFPQ